VLTLLVAMGLSSNAQERPRQPAEQQERQILELPVQELDSEMLRVKVPHCPKPPVVQMHDVPDNFTSPGSAVTLSPALTAFLQNNNISPKGYDDNRVNKVFADSFRLLSCKVCYATLEVGVRHYQDLWTNDTITVGGAPFNPSSLRVLSAPIWTSPLPSPINVTGPLNSYIFNNNTAFLDIVAQDDTDFDFAKLSIWYY
jgi:hypothetical protein